MLSISSGFHMPYPAVSTTVLGQDAFFCLQMRTLSKVGSEEGAPVSASSRVLCGSAWPEPPGLATAGRPLFEGPGSPAL